MEAEKGLDSLICITKKILVRVSFYKPVLQAFT